MNVQTKRYFKFNVIPVLCHPNLVFIAPIEEGAVENFLFNNKDDAIDYVENYLAQEVSYMSYGEEEEGCIFPSVERIDDNKWIVGMYDAVLELYSEDICFV